MSDSQVVEAPFPAPTKQALGTVDGVPTEVSSVSFEDKILVTLSQEGRLSQWVYRIHGLGILRRNAYNAADTGTTISTLSGPVRNVPAKRKSTAHGASDTQDASWWRGGRA